MDLKETAYFYFLHYGLNVIPCYDKVPLVEWKVYQTKKQTLADFEGFPWEKANGFEVIGGDETNTGLFLACIDFDVKTQSPEAITKGKEAISKFLITQLEETPSKGQHLIYLCEQKPRSISAYLGVAAIELIGSKPIVMAPSKDSKGRSYVRLNDNFPSIISDLEAMFFGALRSVGIKVSDGITKSTHGVSKFELPNKFKPLKNSEEERIVNFLCKYWIRGYRNRVTMYFLGYAVKKGISEESAYRILSEVTSRMVDEERGQRLAQVSYHYHKLDSASRFIGKSGLKEIIRMVNSGKV